MPVIDNRTYQNYVAMANRLIAEHGFDTVGFGRRNGKLEILYGDARKVYEAVRALSGNELLELAHTADSGNTASTREALRALHVDITKSTASMLICDAAAAALALLIAGRVKNPPQMTDK
jgi:hypothetical protein